MCWIIALALCFLFLLLMLLPYVHASMEKSCLLCMSLPTILIMIFSVGGNIPVPPFFYPLYNNNMHFYLHMHMEPHRSLSLFTHLPMSFHLSYYYSFEFLHYPPALLCILIVVMFGFMLMIYNGHKNRHQLILTNMVSHGGGSSMYITCVYKVLQQSSKWLNQPCGQPFIACSLFFMDRIDYSQQSFMEKTYQSPSLFS